MLIDVTSFTSGPRQVENAVEEPKTANQVAVSERIKGYIAFFQPVFIRRAVGCVVGTEIEKYLDGHDEEDNEKEYIIQLLKEPFAEFVFFYMLRDMNVQPTITGLVKLKCANDYASTIDKGVQAWNRMVDGLNLFAKGVEGLGVEGVIIDDDMLTYINAFNL